MKNSKKSKSFFRTFFERGNSHSGLDDDFLDEISVEVIGPSNRVSASDWLDERTPHCPSCESVLKRIPAAKTKCPNCNQFMFVRTDPRSKSRRIVNESELEEIEEAWSLRNGTWDEREQAKQERSAARISLRIALGREPSDLELDMDNLRHERSESLTFRQMGDVRNSYLTEGQILQKAGEFRAAAIALITVVLLDGNGSMNALEVYEVDDSGNEMRTASGTGFDMRGVMYLPFLAKEISKCIGKGNVSEADLLREASQMNLEKELNCVVPLAEVWASFKAQTSLG